MKSLNVQEILQFDLVSGF